MEDFLKSLNPKDQALIYGQRYSLYRNGYYIGCATWTKDENVGDSFQRTENGKSIVFTPDSWELLD